MLDYIILGLLLHCSMSGYDVRQFMAQSTAFFYEASFGSIYPTLKKLEESGLVRSEEQVSGGKLKKVYEINGTGREAFLKWLGQPIEMDRYRHTHLVKLFFLEFLPRERAKAMIENFLAKVDSEIKALEGLEKEIECHASIFQRGTLEYGKGYYQYTVDWYKEFLKKMDEQGEENPV